MYKDHHNLFRLLLKDPIEHKETILKIRHEMLNNSLLPTEYFINEYLCCCIKWGELDSALKLLDECLKDQIAISLQSWQALMKCHVVSNDPEIWKKGISLYEKVVNATPAVRPNAQIYIQVMTLFTKLNLNEKVEEGYFEAEENLERLVHAQSKRMHCENELELSIWRANTHVQFFNAFLNSFLDNPQKIKNEYSEFSGCGILKMATKEAPNTFNLLFKNLKFVSANSDRRELLEFYRDELKKNEIKATYLHYSLMIEYSSDSEKIKYLYNQATTNGGAHIPPSKLPHLDTSFISALTRIDPKQGLDALQLIHQRNASDLDAKKPMRFVYQKLIDQFQTLGDEENASMAEFLLHS